jgi:NADH:ubiquinone oxidoreductase subunit K
MPALSGLSATALLDVLNPLLALFLLGVGLVCLMTCRRVMQQVIGLCVMLQGGLLSLVDAGRVQGDLSRAESMVVSALVAETIVVAIALALIVNVYRFHPHGLVDDLDALKG